MGDLFVEQAARRGERRVLGADGVRRQLTARAALDAGLGGEFRGPADRSSLVLAAGISIGF
ncbi:MAG: hypothetical protein ACRD6R_12820 [Candidatus Polarisedimenticolia bacterium]